MIVAINSQTTIPQALTPIAAGPAVEIGEEYKKLDVNEMITRGREGFVAYEVTGDSMVDAIQHGNIVFVDTWVEPRNGDIIASTVNGLTCVKVLQHTPSGLYLVSKNDRYKPWQITPGDSFKILGVVKSHLAFH